MKQGKFTLFPMADISHSYSNDQRIVLHLGDALQFLKSIPNDTVQLIISSPPYNIGKEYETKTSIENYLREQEPVMAELVRILSSKGSLCWEVGNFVQNSEIFPLDVFYYKIFKGKGLKLRNRVIWQFGHGLHASKRFSGRYETVLWFTKGDEYIFNLDDVRVPAKYPGKTYYKGPNHGKPSGNPLGKNPSDIWQLVSEEWADEVWNIPNVKSNHPEKTIHPCQFPIELVERFVIALTNEDDWVLDPYCGVGSAMIAGLKHNRRAMGCDKEATYIDIARERITDLYSGMLRMRPLGKQVYIPTGREKVSQVPDEWKRQVVEVE